MISYTVCCISYKYMSICGILYIMCTLSTVDVKLRHMHHERSMCDES